MRHEVNVNLQEKFQMKFNLNRLLKVLLIELSTFNLDAVCGVFGLVSPPLLTIAIGGKLWR